ARAGRCAPRRAAPPRRRALGVGSRDVVRRILLRRGEGWGMAQPLHGRATTTARHRAGLRASAVPTAVPLNDEPHIARFLRAPTRYRIAVTERTEEGRDVARPVRPGVFDLPILVAHRARRAASQALRGP